MNSQLKAPRTENQVHFDNGKLILQRCRCFFLPSSVRCISLSCNGTIHFTGEKRSFESRPSCVCPDDSWFVKSEKVFSLLLPWQMTQMNKKAIFY